MTDKRALKTLFTTYWSSSGWRPEDQQTTNPADFDHAKRAGVMFDPLVIDHDALIARLLRARDALTLRAVADGFLASLSTRRLDLRSAIGSYACFAHLTAHAFTPRDGHCTVCGTYAYRTEGEDLNVLNFERHKWGGVRHNQPLYAMLDLECFASEPVPAVTDEDVAIFRALLAAIEGAPPRISATALQASLPKPLAANKAEREIIIEILGHCGALRDVFGHIL